MLTDQNKIDALAKDHFVDLAGETQDELTPKLKKVFEDYRQYFPDWHVSFANTCVFRQMGPFIQRIRVRHVPHTKEFLIYMNLSCKLKKNHLLINEDLLANKKRFGYNCGLTIRYSAHDKERCEREIEKMKWQFRPRLFQPLTPKSIRSILRYRRWVIDSDTMDIKIGRAVLLVYEGKLAAASSFAKRALKSETKYLTNYIRDNYEDDEAGKKVWADAQKDFLVLENLIKALDTGTHLEFLNANDWN